MEDFCLYSEIFWEATSEASNIFCWLLCNKTKIFRGYSETFCWFSAFHRFDLINPNLCDTIYWCRVQIAFAHSEFP